MRPLSWVIKGYPQRGNAAPPQTGLLVTSSEDGTPEEGGRLRGGASRRGVPGEGALGEGAPGGGRLATSAVPGGARFISRAPLKG